MESVKAINAARRAAKAKAAKERGVEASQVQTGVQRRKRKKLSAVKKHILKERRAGYEARLLDDVGGPPPVELLLTAVDDEDGECRVKLELRPTAQHNLPLRASSKVEQDGGGTRANEEGGEEESGDSDSEVDQGRERERGLGLHARSAEAAAAMAWQVQGSGAGTESDPSATRSPMYASAAELPASRSADMPRYTGPGVSIRYCDQVITRALNDAVDLMLAKLMYYQERARARDPIKAKARRRVCSGMREVGKLVDRGKLKLLVVAPNIEEIKGPRGLDSLVARMVAGCRANKVPVVFALSKARLGTAVTARGGAHVSVCAVINYEGAGDEYLAVLREAQAGYQAYLEGRGDERGKQ